MSDPTTDGPICRACNRTSSQGCTCGYTPKKWPEHKPPPDTQNVGRAPKQKTGINLMFALTIGVALTAFWFRVGWELGGNVMRYLLP